MPSLFDDRSVERIRSAVHAVEGMSVGSGAQQRQPRIWPQQQGGGRSVRMIIKQQFNDHLRCRRITETAEGVFSESETDVLVAKPPKLRHAASQYPGVSGITTVSPSEVTAANGENETWIVHWPYTVGDHIYASKAQGGSGVWVNDEQLSWIDDNRDGRVWRLVEDDD